MRKRTPVLFALVFLLALPSLAQQRRRATRPPGPLRFGEEVRAQAGTLVCRPLYLRGKTPKDDVLLDYVAGEGASLLEGYVGYRGCRMSFDTNPPRLEGLGGWAVVNVAAKHVEYLRLNYFDDTLSQPAWNGNLVAYWGVFVPVDPRMAGQPGVLQAMVVDWQHKLIVARQATQLEVPSEGELPAPRWVKKGSVAYQRPAEARFEFAGQTVRLQVSPRFLR